MNISQVLTKLKALIYSKSETDSLLGGKANSSHTHTKSQITDFPSLATVATSGSYTDLSNKPTIPSKVSQLSNDSGFITSSGSCNYANYSGYVQGKRATGTYVNEVKYGNALVTTNQTSFGAIWNAPTKNYRVACATYPSNNDEVYLCYSITNDNVSSSTNTTNKMLTWNAGTGILSATGFSGPLTGNVTGNCSGSAGSVAWSNVSGKPSIPSIDLRPQASADANTVSDGVSITHYGSNGPATSLGASTTDGALFQQCWSSAWKVQIAADYRNGNLFTRGKNNGTWQPWRAVAYHGDKVSKFTNDSGYITSSGSCNYANSAGNSDTLDGYHEYSFLRYRGNTSTSGEGTLWSQIGIKDYNNALPDGLSGVYQWGEVVSLAGGNGRFDIYCSHNSSNGNGLYYRSGWANDKKDWRLFIDSANIGSQSVNYANSAGSARTVTDSSCINPTSGNYSEGIRFNKSTNGWTAITIGTASGTTNGAMNGTGWGIFCDTSDNFIINNFDSSTGNAALYCSDKNTYISNLHISGGYKIYVG